MSLVKAKAEACQTPTPSVTGLFVLLWDLAPILQRALGALKSHCLCCSWGRFTLPCIRLVLSSCCPLQSPKPAQPWQPSLCPELGVAPHITLHISSQAGQGVDSAPPRQCHTPYRSFCAAVLQCGLGLLCVGSRVGKPLRVCWVQVGRGRPSAGKARYSWICFYPFAKAKRV